MTHFVAHIGIYCKNIVESENFYAQFGFTIAASIKNYRGYHISMITNSDFTIELYEPLNEFETSKDNRVHLAIGCDDINEQFEFCKSINCEIVDEITSTKIFAPAKCWYFNIKGPGGEIIEFTQLETV